MSVTASWRFLNADGPCRSSAAASAEVYELNCSPRSFLLYSNEDRKSGTFKAASRLELYSVHQSCPSELDSLVR